MLDFRKSLSHECLLYISKNATSGFSKKTFIVSDLLNKVYIFWLLSTRGIHQYHRIHPSRHSLLWTDVQLPDSRRRNSRSEPLLGAGMLNHGAGSEGLRCEHV